MVAIQVQLTKRPPVPRAANTFTLHQGKKYCGGYLPELEITTHLTIVAEMLETVLGTGQESGCEVAK